MPRIGEQRETVREINAMSSPTTNADIGQPKPPSADGPPRHVHAHETSGTIVVKRRAICKRKQSVKGIAIMQTIQARLMIADRNGTIEAKPTTSTPEDFHDNID